MTWIRLCSLGLLALATASLLASCSGESGGAGAETAAAQTAEGAGTCTTGEPGMAPTCSLPDLDGNVVALSESPATVRLIDFWATWCAPCREEIPMFKELYELYGPDGFALVAVSMDDGPDVVRDFVEEFEIPYPNLMGNDDVADAFGGIFGLPTAFLVDGDGRIVERFMGPKPRKILEGRIREMLGLAPAA